jgi:hypothetical protein
MLYFIPTYNFAPKDPPWKSPSMWLSYILPLGYFRRIASLTTGKGTVWRLLASPSWSFTGPNAWGVIRACNNTPRRRNGALGAHCQGVLVNAAIVLRHFAGRVIRRGTRPFTVWRLISTFDNSRGRRGGQCNQDYDDELHRSRDLMLINREQAILK